MLTVGVVFPPISPVQAQHGCLEPRELAWDPPSCNLERDLPGRLCVGLLVLLFWRRAGCDVSRLFWH